MKRLFVIWKIYLVDLLPLFSSSSSLSGSFTAIRRKDICLKKRNFICQSTGKSLFLWPDTSAIIPCKHIVAKSSGGSDSSLFLRYTFLTIGANLAAASESVLGSAVFFRWSPVGVILLAATTYSLSGCITLLMPASEAGDQPERPRWGTALRLSLRPPALWRAMLFTCMGWFLSWLQRISVPKRGKKP